jgi:ferredoxin
MPTVTFVNEKKTIEVPAGANLRKEAIKAGIQPYPFPHNLFPFNCHGLGLCGSCRMVIKKGVENCSPQSVAEKLSKCNLFNPMTLDSRLCHDNTLRLSCQTRVNGDIEVVTQPPVNWHGEKFWG